MHMLQNMFPQDGHCCLKQKTKIRLPVFFLIFIILLAKICEGKHIVNLIAFSKDNKKALTTNTNSRRTVRLVIRNVPLETTEDHIYKRFARERDRSLVKIIRSKRKKRQHGEDKMEYISPTNRRVVRIKSKTGFFLEILPSGKVAGHVNKTKFTKMELQVITPQVKRIKSVETGKYLAINKKGKVITKDISDKETYFFEELSENLDYLYCSVKYPKADSALSWYLGLKINKGKRSIQGKAKRASRTLPGDNSTHFSISNELI